jgi:3-isopropylmalate dehydrogenase
MSRRIVLLPGDGIGPEVVDAGRRVLDHVAARFGLRLSFDERPIGGAAIDRHGEPLPPATLAACRAADAILLGAVGGPKWAEVPVAIRPEQGLLSIRRELGLYANLRPVRIHPALAEHSPVRPERVRGVDFLVVRELTGGIYFGARTRTAERASDECAYTVAEIERVTRSACRLARARRARIASVDKANVLETSRLWREVVTRVVKTEFPELALEHLLVDAMAMFLITRPRDFDVILTENLFGDILTDEAAAVAGSLGLMPSASVGDRGPGLFEPIHGSAPDIAGKGVANPYGTILSAAMLLRIGLGQDAAASAIETAVDAAIQAQVLTRDLGGSADTHAATAAVIDRITAQSSASARRVAS